MGQRRERTGCRLGAEDVGKHLDMRMAALDGNPNQKKYTLKEIAARLNVRL